jgi:hypothetical protein
MDNILKLVLGCLGAVAVLVMLIPDGDPLSKKPAEAVATSPVAAPSPANTPPAAPPTGTPESGSSFTVQDHDIASFGKPMVDPTPPGQVSAQQMELGPDSGGSIASPPPPQNTSLAPGYGASQPNLTKAAPVPQAQAGTSND